MKRSFSFFTLILMILFSCNKDQLSLNKLEGKWEQTLWTIDSQEYELHDLDITSIIYDFKVCKVKEGNCNLNMITKGSVLGVESELMETVSYSISDKGSTLTMDMISWEIKEQTKTGFMISTVLNSKIHEKTFSRE